MIKYNESKIIKMDKGSVVGIALGMVMIMRNVIFDIGSVLVEFDPERFFCERFANEHMEEVCPLIFDDIWAGTDRGDYLCAVAQRMHHERYPQYRKQIDLIYAHWMEMMTLKEESVAYLKECRKHGYRVYLLSNIGKESYEYLRERYAFFQMVDGMTLSFEERCIKPEPQIYQALLTRWRLSAADCVFFDDQPRNIQTAIRLGMRGIVFENIEQARKEAALW